MTFNLFTFYAIVRQAVIDMAYNPGLSVNSFSVVDERADPMQDSYGATFEDYEAGYFWSRRWRLQGASPEAIKGEFPVLFLEEQETTTERAQQDNTTQTISFVLMDKLECALCPKTERRTPLVVRENLKRMARAIIAEISQYRLYERDMEMVWASPGRAETWEGGEPNYTEELADYLDLRNLRFRKWGNFPGLRGILVEVKIRSCERPGLDFDYTTEPSPFLGAINCGC